MNNVSWFFYIADILTGVQVLLGFLGFIGTLVGGVAFATSFCYDTERKYRYYSDKGQEVYNTITYPLEQMRPWAVGVFTIAFLFAFMAIAIPSRDTRYLIAASQVGEQIIQLEEVQSVGGEVGGLAKDTIELLRQSIQEQLTEKPVEAPKPD